MNQNLISIVFCLFVFMVRLSEIDVSPLVQFGDITIAKTIVVGSNQVSVRE